MALGWACYWLVMWWPRPFPPLWLVAWAGYYAYADRGE